MEAFVYRWRHKNGMWYIGYHKGTADDGYICSSNYAKPQIQQNPGDWTRKILRWGSKRDMIDLEMKLLGRLDARNNPKSYNRSNGFDAIGTEFVMVLKVVGAETNNNFVPEVINQAFCQKTGRTVYHSVLKTFFDHVKNKRNDLIRAYIPTIRDYFGIILDYDYLDPKSLTDLDQQSA